MLTLFDKANLKRLLRVFAAGTGYFNEVLTNQLSLLRFVFLIRNILHNEQIAGVCLPRPMLTDQPL